MTYIKIYIYFNFKSGGLVLLVVSTMMSSITPQSGMPVREEVFQKYHLTTLKNSMATLHSLHLITMSSTVLIFLACILVCHMKVIHIGEGEVIPCIQKMRILLEVDLTWCTIQWIRAHTCNINMRISTVIISLSWIRLIQVSIRRNNTVILNTEVLANLILYHHKVDISNTYQNVLLVLGLHKVIIILLSTRIVDIKTTLIAKVKHGILWSIHCT